MPRNVRNFWIDADIDGRKETLSGGPNNKTGGMRAKIYMRDKGSVSHAVTIEATAGKDGHLTLEIWGSNQDRIVYKLVTER